MLFSINLTQPEPMQLQFAEAGQGRVASDPKCAVQRPREGCLCLLLLQLLLLLLLLRLLPLFRPKLLGKSWRLQQQQQEQQQRQPTQ